jgi:hypothetical protein
MKLSDYKRLHLGTYQIGSILAIWASMNRLENLAGSAVAEGATVRSIAFRVTAPIMDLLHPCLRVSE